MEMILPNENQRYEILNSYMSKIKNKIASNVDLKLLANLTENFNKEELITLIIMAQSNAMKRLIEMKNKTKSNLDSTNSIMDLKSLEDIMLIKDDFLHVLHYELQPEYNTSTKILTQLLDQKIISWGEPVNNILENANKCVSLIREVESCRLVCILFEGSAGTGKTLFAAHTAKTTYFSFIKVCRPEDMIDFTESAKCEYIKKIFNDAYRSRLSCILLDDLLRIIEYTSIGPKCSNMILQTLLILLKQLPPFNHRLLILCTSNNSQALIDLKLISVFNTVINVPKLSNSSEIIKVLEKLNIIPTHQMDDLYQEFNGKHVAISMKKLLHIINIISLIKEGSRIQHLLSELEKKDSKKYKPFFSTDI